MSNAEDRIAKVEESSTADSKLLVEVKTEQRAMKEKLDSTDKKIDRILEKLDK
jgi:hypothetical protein